MITGLALASYRPAGFSYPAIIPTQPLVEGGATFILTLNLSKLMAGWLVLLTFLDRGSPLLKKRDWRLFLPLGVGAIVLVLAAGCFLLDLRWQLKSIDHIWRFALVNLVSTCVAEEAFMRLLVQAQLAVWCQSLTRFWSWLLPLIGSTSLFVLAHSGLAWQAMVVYFLAGLCYGLIYTLTGRVGYAILLHFGVNILHFSLLTYPIA
ncbi:CPBP family intramembrane glutamic endopeptidase [Halioxenophilus sp. WMMB6]|uniref:CPBP family intramembrane glutamic endopeptidase n=1 Tax=Halioxenophilus sp. WMMB6 TaxID=3073815 RepID=UPI00295EF9F3|nr:CPBP family intramembrane glutamic endopeptidase [Halioxenophilus sp. WMMB6]